MPGTGRLFILEVFGKVCSKIGYFLLNNRDMSLSSMNRHIDISRKDLIKGLSLLIHFKIVGFTNYSGRGTRYFIIHKNNSITNYPVYVDYAERTYGEEGAQILAQILIRGRVQKEMIPDSLSKTVEHMIKDSIITEESITGVKRLKEDTGKSFIFSKSQTDARILNEIFCRDITKYFTENTRRVFSAVRSFYPAPSSFSKVLERCREMAVLSETASEKGFNETVHKHLKYLMGYGAVSGGYEMYQINHEAYIDKIKEGIVMEYCDMYHGPVSSAVLSMVLRREYVEDKFVQKYLLIESSESKRVLFALLSERLVSLQMVPRTADCAPSKSFHLWSSNIHRLIPAVAQKVHEKINRGYLDLSDLQENRMLALPQEYKEKKEALFSSLERLHFFSYVLGL